MNLNESNYKPYVDTTYKYFLRNKDGDGKLDNMLDKKVLEDRFKEIRKRRKLLVKYARMSFEQFSADLEVYELALRHLQVAIQACIDIGKHIAAVNNFEAPERSSKIFSVLSKHKIISKSLAQRLNQAGGVRNILVHEYLGVDLEKIYEHLKKDLPDFDQFIVEINNYLKNY